MFEIIKKYNRTQQVGVGIIAINAAYIAYVVSTNKPLKWADPMFQIALIAEIFYIGYGLGKSRPIEVKITDTRPIG